MGRGADRPARTGYRRPGCRCVLNTALTDLRVEDGVVADVYVRTGPAYPEKPGADV